MDTKVAVDNVRESLKNALDATQKDAGEIIIAMDAYMTDVQADLETMIGLALQGNPEGLSTLNTIKEGAILRLQNQQEKFADNRRHDAVNVFTGILHGAFALAKAALGAAGAVGGA